MTRELAGAHLRGPGWAGVLDSKVVGQRQLDLSEPISGGVVDGSADDVVHVDRADLIDQPSRQPASDFEFGTMYGWTGAGRRRNNGDDGQRRVQRGSDQAQSHPTRFTSGLTNVAHAAATSK